MRNLIFICYLILLIPSCNSADSKKDKAVNENTLNEQNQKIKELEEKLSNIEKSNSTHNDPPTNINVNRKDHFYIGDTEAEVLAVQGTPTGIQNYGVKRIYSYDFSSVTFQDGRVTDYRDLSNNLRVQSDNNSGNIQNGNERPNSITKYVFFEGSGYYSKIFTLNDYTEDKMLALKNCIKENIQNEAGRDKTIYCTERIFKSYKSATEEYQILQGKKMFFDRMCDLMLSHYN